MSYRVLVRGRATTRTLGNVLDDLAIGDGQAFYISREVPVGAAQRGGSEPTEDLAAAIIREFNGEELPSEAT